MLRLLTLGLLALILHECMLDWQETDEAEEAVSQPAAAEDEAPAAEPAPEPEQAVLPELPSAGQVAALEPELRLRQATAIKAVLLRQTLQLMRDNRRLTPENLRQSAESAQAAGVPGFWVQAMRVLAGGALSGAERHRLNNDVEAFYALYRVESLAIRLFVETAGLSPRELDEAAAWLPLEHLFNLPPAETATPDELARQAVTLREVFSTLREQLAAVHDKESADAAADALLPLLAPFDSTMQLRMADPQSQVQAFSGMGDSMNEIYGAIRNERIRLHAADFHASPRLRALDYFLQ